MKVAVIYNIFGGNGRNNNPYYIDAIKSLIMQDISAVNGQVDLTNYKICVSGCMIPDNQKWVLWNEFSYLSMNFTTDLLPVNVTFNQTVMKMKESFGEFDCYIYVDSGINFWNLHYGIRALYETYKSGKYAIVCAEPSNDKGYEWWDADKMMGPIVDIPLGKAMNAHCNLYGKELLDAYGHILPDIFGHDGYTPDTSESVHSFLCAAVGKGMAIDKRVTVFHNHNMDGGSAFRKSEYRPLKPIMQMGKAFGMGWEECNPELGVLHDETQFDEHGHSRNPLLKDFIKHNLYGKFNYSQISSHWRAGV